MWPLLQVSHGLKDKQTIRKHLLLLCFPYSRVGYSNIMKIILSGRRRGRSEGKRKEEKGRGKSPMRELEGRARGGAKRQRNADWLVASLVTPVSNLPRLLTCTDSDYLIYILADLFLFWPQKGIMINMDLPQ